MLVVGPQTARAATPSAASYRLDLRWHEPERTLAGTETVRFRNTGTAPIDRVWFRLWPNGWRPVGSSGRPGGCAAPRMTATVVAGGRAGRRPTDCSALEVLLSRPLRPAATATVRLRFAVRAPLAEDRFGRAPNGVTALGNAVPVLAVTDARGTHLEPYSSVGESFYSLTAAWDLRLRLPRGLKAATTGRTLAVRALPGGATLVHARTPRARDLALAVGRFRIHHSRAGPVHVRVFRPVDDRGLRASSRSVADLVGRSLTRLADLYGPYPSREYDVVLGRFSTFGGMEYPELVLTRTDPAPVVHETAHQWWYGLVGSNQRAEPWLDESFATFAHRRILGGLERCDVADPLGRRWGSGPLNASMDAFDARPAHLGRIYAGGACALESLRRAWGTARFDRLLRRFVDRHRFGVATTASFLAAVRAEAPRGFDVEAWRRRVRLV